MSHTVLCTEGLLFLARQADKNKLNRRVKTELLETQLDPNGIHLVGFRLLHNDVEWRLNIFAKVIDQTEPVEFWLDASFDDYHKVERTSDSLVKISQRGH